MPKKGPSYNVIVVGIFHSSDALQQNIQKMEAELRALMENRDRKQRLMKITINPLTYINNFMFILVNMVHKKPDDVEVLRLAYDVRDKLKECGAGVILQKDVTLFYNENILLE